MRPNNVSSRMMVLEVTWLQFFEHLSDFSLEDHLVYLAMST